MEKKKRVVLRLEEKVRDNEKYAVPDGMSIICICCWDNKGKLVGVVSLLIPFNQYYWCKHISGDKHISASVKWDYCEEQEKKRKIKTKFRRVFHSKVGDHS